MMRQCSRRYIIFWHDQSSIRPSIYFSSIVKQSSNPFQEPTSTEQHVKGFLLKETTGAFDGAGTQDLHITSQVRNHWSMHDGSITVLLTQTYWHCIMLAIMFTCDSCTCLGSPVVPLDDSNIHAVFFGFTGLGVVMRSSVNRLSYGI